MVDLQQLVVVRQSAVQGGQDTSFSGARVLSYFIYHSINGEDWFPILEREHIKVKNIFASTGYVNKSFYATLLLFNYTIHHFRV